MWKRALEVQPLLREIRLLAAGREADFVVLVVLLHQVLDDGAGFPEREVCVGIDDGGHAAVGVELGELGALDVGELHVVEVVRDAQFLRDHADLGRVRAVLAVDLDGLDRHDW